MKSSMTITVCYEDTDAGGVVYHSKYLGFAERARMDFLHNLGIYCKDMMDLNPPCGFMLTRCEMDFKKPAHLEDEITIESEITSLTGVRFDCTQTVKRNEEILVVMKLFLVCVKPSGRPTRIPDEIKEKLSSLL